MMPLYNIMRALSTSEEFAKVIQDRIPDLLADIISYRLNPNCTCKQKIYTHFESNESDRAFAEDWIIKYLSDPLLEVSIPKNDITPRMVLKTSLPSTEWGNYKDMVGEYVEIEANPDKYKELMATARDKWLYNGLSVLETVKTDPETKTEKFVWIVFFY